MFSRHSTKAGIFTLALAAASIAAVPALMASHPAAARDNDGDHGRHRDLAWGHDRHHHGRGDGDHGGNHQPPVVAPPPVTPPTTPPPDHPPA